MMTIFDEPVDAKPLPATLDSGSDPTVVVYDGVTRGVSILCRCTRFEALIGLKVEPTPDDLHVTMKLTLDDVAHAWWLRKYDDLPEHESRRPRHIVVRCQGKVIAGCSVGGEHQQQELTFTVPGGTVNPGGLLMLHLSNAPTQFAGASNENALLGIQVDSIDIRSATATPSSRIFIADRDTTGVTFQGTALLNKDPITARFRIIEKPQLHSRLRRFRLTRPLGRLARKVGVMARATKRRMIGARRGPIGSWPLTAFDAQGSAVEVTAELHGNGVVAVRFPDTVNSVVFFEVTTDPTHLVRAGYVPSVKLQPLP